MNIKKITYLIVVILFSVSSSIPISFSLGCSGKYGNNKKWSQEIEEYESKLDDFNTYDREVFLICCDYAEIINTLVEKFNASGSDLDKKTSYADLLAGQYNNWYRDLSAITASGFLKDLHQYRLDRLIKKESWYRYFADNAGKGDINMIGELKEEIESAETECEAEYERILEYFNNEASKLGLSEPFPDL